MSNLHSQKNIIWDLKWLITDWRFKWNSKMYTYANIYIFNNDQLRKIQDTNFSLRIQNCQFYMWVLYMVTQKLTGNLNY